MEAKLKEILKTNKEYLEQGQLADYIPELKNVDANKLGLSLRTTDNRIYNIGDCKQKFTIQSISKIISLMIAVLENGEEEVFKKVGYYGTDDPFNSYYKLETKGIPLNPMMNAGAILITSLIEGDGEEPFNKILDMIRYITKNDEISYSREVYLSESKTGDRNRGIFNLLRANGLIDKEEEALENYFKQCSIEVSCEDLSKIGLFFANNCIRYDGDREYENKELSRLINSIMLNSGMYDKSGEFSRKVGLPSKSGVGGGIVSLVPGKLGIGVFSPRLDKAGNSLVGVKVLEDISKEFDLSIF